MVDIRMSNELRDNAFKELQSDIIPKEEISEFISKSKDVLDQNTIKIQENAKKIKANENYAKMINSKIV